MPLAHERRGVARIVQHRGKRDLARRHAAVLSVERIHDAKPPRHLPGQQRRARGTAHGVGVKAVELSAFLGQPVEVGRRHRGRVETNSCPAEVVDDDHENVGRGDRVLSLRRCRSWQHTSEKRGEEQNGGEGWDGRNGQANEHHQSPTHQRVSDCGNSERKPGCRPASVAGRRHHFVGIQLRLSHVAMSLSISTMTTVGYGDIIPVSS